MAAKKVHQVRMSPEGRTDAIRVNDDLTITRSWTEISATVAKELVGWKDKDKPYFEFRETSPDNGAAEDSGNGEEPSN